MSRVWAFILVAGSVAVAAPVPPESDKEKVARVWGKVPRASESYTVKPEGGLLTLRSIGYPVRYEYEVPPFQVTREVTGDFDVRVKVYALDSPRRDVHYENGSPQTAAGLFIDGGDCSIGLYRWKAVHKHNGVLQEGMQDSPWLSRRPRNGGSGSSLGQWEAGQSGYLRIVRKGEALTAFTSRDGKVWKDWDANTEGLKLRPTVTIGLFVGHTTSQECSATFAEFSIEKPK